MGISIFKNLVSYLFSNDTSKMEEAKPLKYVSAGNGQFEVRSTPLMDVAKKIDAIPNLPNMKEGISLHVPKMPFEIFNIMTSFMKKIYEQDNTESTVMVFYNRERAEFIPWAPLQDNGAASSDYQRDDDPAYKEMCANNILVMVAHSHPWGSGGVTTSQPHPSGIDDKDEKEALLYMVVGNVKGVPTTYVSTCPGGKRMKLNFFDVFENPMIAGLSAENQGLAQLLTKYVPDHEIFPMYCDTDTPYPADWLKRCKKKVTTVTTYTSGSAWRSSDIARQANKYYSGYYGYDLDGQGDEFGDDFGDYGLSGWYGRGHYPERLAEEEVEEDLKTSAEGGDASYVEEDEEDDTAAYGLIDVVDACTMFSDIQIAQLVFALIQDGRGSVIHKCIQAKNEGKMPPKQSEPPKQLAGAKSAGVPGLQLIKHNKKNGKKK